MVNNFYTGDYKSIRHTSSPCLMWIVPNNRCLHTAHANIELYMSITLLWHRAKPLTTKIYPCQWQIIYAYHELLVFTTSFTPVFMFKYMYLSNNAYIACSWWIIQLLQDTQNHVSNELPQINTSQVKNLKLAIHAF